MILKQDIRIGNVVLSTFDEMPKHTHLTINSVSDSHPNISRELVYVSFRELGSQYMHLNNKIDGVPLTPEILLNSGFVLYHENDFGRQFVLKRQPKNFYVVINDKKNTFAIQSEFTAINNIPCHETRFIHNLQNAYFLATGEEIEIKIPEK